jgi:pyrimidine-nucleoside phosphorylase
MRAVDIIIKKRDRGELTREEIEFFIKGFASGEIPDYQASAFAMAVVLNGMTPRETTDLTLAMAHSGQMLDLSDVVDFAVDKHSSGGVGDKTSLVVLPVVVACGLPVGKMSGRGLGFSGGTLDKMESIPGYRVDLTTEEFKRQLKEKGIVLSGQSLDLAPADGKLYALRDVTGTVQSIPLIASSIMCKKLAGGAQAIVLDVKTGLGAFMTTLEEARQLASLMVDIGKLAGREVVALLSDMNQPLGCAVGNALEVIEAIETLKGGGPADFREHCLHIAAHMLVIGKRAKTLEEARSMAPLPAAQGWRNSGCWWGRRAAMCRMWMTSPNSRARNSSRWSKPLEAGTFPRSMPEPWAKRRWRWAPGARRNPIPLTMPSASSSIEKWATGSRQASRSSPSTPMTLPNLPRRAGLSCRRTSSAMMKLRRCRCFTPVKVRYNNQEE